MAHISKKETEIKLSVRYEKAFLPKSDILLISLEYSKSLCFHFKSNKFFPKMETKGKY